MFDGTPATKKLCKQMCKSSKGEVILMFSLGKDSTAMWQFLIECGFTKIHPIYCEVIPGLKCVQRSLRYYEKKFDTKIHRYLMNEGLPQIGDMVFQPAQDQVAIEELGLWTYRISDVAEMFRQEHDIHDRVWSAEGILQADALVRRTYINKYGPKIKDYQVFYPIYDWKPNDLLDFLKGRNIKLSEEYQYSNRTFCGPPKADALERLKQVRPEDFEAFKLWYPLIEANMARNIFRRRHLGHSEAVELGV